MMPTNSTHSTVDHGAANHVRDCPFCGHYIVAEVSYKPEPRIYVIRCEHCYAEGPEGKSFIEAATKWNERMR